jgi:drug/metabolite transporter (DMT)-like permease
VSPLPAINRTMSPADWGLLLALSVLWGGSFFFVGIAVKELPPLTLVALRVSLAAIILLVVVRARGQSMPRDPKAWFAFTVAGFLGSTLPFCLIVWGQTHIASGLASILNATTPISTAIVAHFLTSDEKLTGNRVLGVLVGFAGVALMIGPDALAGLGNHVWAQIAVLCATISYALVGVYARVFKRLGIPPLIAATGQVTMAAVLLSPVALALDAPWTLPMPSLKSWLAILGIAALSTSLAYVLFFRILSSSGATNVALVTFLVPVSAILLGSLVLGERLEPKHFAGMAFITLGLAAIDGRVFRLLRGSASARR